MHAMRLPRSSCQAKPIRTCYKRGAAVPVPTRTLLGLLIGSCVPLSTVPVLPHPAQTSQLSRSHLLPDMDMFPIPCRASQALPGLFQTQLHILTGLIN